MTVTLDLTKLTAEQQWLATVLNVLTTLFLCTLLYNPTAPVRPIITSSADRRQASLTLPLFVQAVTPNAVWGLTRVTLMYIISTSIQRASIAAVTRQLTTVLLYGG
jgi:squalene cyclase